MQENKTIPQVLATITRINQQSLEAQRKLLLEHLQGGNTINFMQAMDMDITHLNTRIQELKAKGLQVYSKPVFFRNIKCQEFSLRPFITT